MAMMSMQELFYGESEPAYFVHSYARQTSLPESRTSRRTEITTCDPTVPKCCKMCEGEVRDSLLDLSTSFEDVGCDPYNQRVTVTGYLDPAQALQQVKRMMDGPTYWSESSYSRQSYEVSLCQKPQYRPQADNSRSYAQNDTTREKRTSYPNHYNRSRSGKYYWTSCPAGYRESAVTHFVSVNPTIATLEMAC